MEFARSIYLGGEVIYANDKSLNNNSYKEWGLYCPECGEEVHLRHGLIREPYFAHFKQITDTQCSLRVSIEGNDEGRWTELEIGRGQRRELFQQHFLALVANNDYSFYIKIEKVKNTISFSTLLFVTKKVRAYLIKNVIAIIKTSIQLYKNKNNASKFKALHVKIISEAIEYLCVESSLNVLEQIIYYSISISEHLVKYDSDHKLKNDNFVIHLVDKVAEIIVNTDWTKQIFTLKRSNLLQQYVLPSMVQPYENVVGLQLFTSYQLASLELLRSKLNRQQQASYLMADILDYTYTLEAKEGKYLTYRLIQISENPFSVAIQNVGEKKTKPIISITLMSDSIKVIKLVNSEDADKVPKKYVFKHNGLLINTHSRAIETIVLPYFIAHAPVAILKNMVTLQWLFVATMATRLDVCNRSLTEKPSIYKFTESDIAYCLSKCIEIMSKYEFPQAIIQMFLDEFMKLKSEVRKPFEFIELQKEKKQHIAKNFRNIKLSTIETNEGKIKYSSANEIAFGFTHNQELIAAIITKQGNRIKTKVKFICFVDDENVRVENVATKQRYIISLYQIDQ